MSFPQIHHFRNFALSIIIGLTSGILGALFLHSLDWVTNQRLSHPQWIWGLPAVGLLIPLLYRSFGFGAEKGVTLILEEIHSPKQVAPWTMAPLIYITTLLTHLVGGSAGREGTALQMAAGAADRVVRLFSVTLTNRKWVLMAGLSGGFSAALGAPWAGMIFGLEVVSVKHIEKQHFVECLIASFVAWFVSMGLHAPHFESRILTVPEFSLPLLLQILGLAILIGLSSRLHTKAVHAIQIPFRQVATPYRTLIGGALLLSLYLAFPLQDYQGLGLHVISQAFEAPAEFTSPLLKLFLTALTLAVGFKGGEFIPLVFIGTTMASAWGALWGQPISFFAGLGFASLFGAAAKTPWACTLLTIEFFGWDMAVYALAIHWISYKVSGLYGIYEGQKL